MYTIIGNGRVAQHMACYFKHLNIPYLHWYRGANVPLESCLESTTHVLLLIADKAIEEFVMAHQSLLQKQVLVHFSAALSTDLAYSAHPLMTFNEQRYSLAAYKQISFILNAEGPDFNYLLPGLLNPNFKIPHASKAYYHALCVLANNFSTLLWQRFFSELRDTLHIPEEAGVLFMEQTFNNLRNNHQTALSGPLSRDDLPTIEKNLQALSNDPFLDVYQAFIEAYKKTNLAEKKTNEGSRLFT